MATIDRTDIEKSIEELQKIVNFMNREYGKALANKELDSVFAPRIALAASKQLLEDMPAMRLFDAASDEDTTYDELSHADSLYGNAIRKLQEARENA